MDPRNHAHQKARGGVGRGPAKPQASACISEAEVNRRVSECGHLNTAKRGLSSSDQARVERAWMQNRANRQREMH